MRMTLHVSYQDGTGADVVASAPDFIQLENKFSRSITRMQDDFRFTDICFLAWSALRRTKQTDLEWEQWIEQIDMVSGEDEPEGIVPLETSPTTGGSPTSP